MTGRSYWADPQHAGHGQIATPEDALVEQYGSLEQYIEWAYLAMLSADQRSMKRHLRDAMRFGAGTQLDLPGMEHAALPMCVFRSYPDGTEEIVPWPKATKGELRGEVARMRRSVAAQDAVVRGYESTLDRLDDLGVGDEVLGEEIVEQFGREIEQ